MTDEKEASRDPNRPFALGSKAWRYPHRDSQYVDEIVITTVPRYKESGLSGDEWRFSARVALKRKGIVILERSYGDVGQAARYLDYLLSVQAPEAPDIMNNRDKAEKRACQQEGCSESASVFYILRKTYSRDGHGEEILPQQTPRFRQFCEKHSRRGDCGLEDADSNYILASMTREGGAVPAVRHELRCETCHGETFACEDLDGELTAICGSCHAVHIIEEEGEAQ